jgi:hypothetical protein
MRRRAALALTVGGLLAFAPRAEAQSAPSSSSEKVTASSPNYAVIGTGVLTFAVSYVPAAIVSATSNQSSDSSLAVPLLGPWIDLGRRPDCGPGAIRCRVETGNQVLLVTDGLFQAWGVVAAVIGIFAKDYSRSSSPVQVAPAQVGGGYGVTAFGLF